MICSITILKCFYHYMIMQLFCNGFTFNFEAVMICLRCVFSIFKKLSYFKNMFLQMSTGFVILKSEQYGKITNSRKDVPCVFSLVSLPPVSFAIFCSFLTVWVFLPPVQIVLCLMLYVQFQLYSEKRCTAHEAMFLPAFPKQASSFHSIWFGIRHRVTWSLIHDMACIVTAAESQPHGTICK